MIHNLLISMHVYVLHNIPVGTERFCQYFVYCLLNYNDILLISCFYWLCKHCLVFLVMNLYR